MRIPLFLFAMVAALLLPSSAVRAEVVVTFWSHARDRNYPHAFLVMRGRVDATGQVVDTNIGFTARSISPMVLLGSVRGQMEVLSPGYVARATSRPHFALRLNDAQYARLQAFIARWRAAPQPNYNLNSRNCVHFIMEAAAELGLVVNRASANFREPGLFLDEVMQLNPRLAPATR